MATTSSLRRWSRAGAVPCLALVAAVGAAVAMGPAPTADAAAGPEVVGVGEVTDVGDLHGLTVNQAVVGMASTPSGGGYWMVAADGGVFAFGDASFFGSMGAVPLNERVVGMASSPSGGGYWMVAADGGVFAFGDAGFLGSTGGLRLNAAVVGIVPTSTGRGYRLVAADGAVFAFGDAAFLGGLGGDARSDPIVALAATVDGGYGVLSSAGDVVGFGGAPTGSVPTARAVALLPIGEGVVVVTSDGLLYPIGAVTVPAPSPDLAGRRVVAASATPDGAGIRLATVPATIEVVAGGDVHGEDRVDALLQRGGDPLAAVADVVATADIALVNLETAVGATGSPDAKQYTFQADPALTRSLARNGVDVVNLANNHTLDFGPGALVETLGHLDAAGLVGVGAGGNAAEAYAPHVVRTAGGPVAFVGLSEVVPPGWSATATGPGVASGWDRAAAVTAVHRAAALADTVIVAVHWGDELDRCASATQRDLAQALVAAGADVIFGTHPHVLQGIDWIDGALVAYSLGNLVWYESRLPSAHTALLRVTLGGGRVVGYEVLPVLIDGDGRPIPVGGALADEIVGATVAFRPGGGICAA